MCQCCRPCLAPHTAKLAGSLAERQQLEVWQRSQLPLPFLTHVNVLQSEPKGQEAGHRQGAMAAGLGGRKGGQNASRRARNK